MRIIPRKTTRKRTIIKNWTITDLIIGLILLIMVFVIIFMNVPTSIKWGLILTMVILAMLSFSRFDGLRGGEFVIRMLAYTVRPKQNLHISPDIIFLEEDKENLKSVVRYSANGGKEIYYGGFLRVDGFDFYLLSLTEQNIRINKFSEALTNSTKCIQFIKLDQFLELYNERDALLDDVARRDSRLKRNLLRARIDQIEKINSEKFLMPHYYIAMYGSNQKEVEIEVDRMFEELEQIGLKPRKLTNKELALMFKFSSTHALETYEVEDYDSDPAELYHFVHPSYTKLNPYDITVDSIDTMNFAIRDYPTFTNNAWLQELFNIPYSKVVITFNMKDTDKAIKEIDRTILDSTLKLKNGGKASDQLQAESEIDIMANLLDDIKNGNQSVFDTTIGITTYNHLGEKLRDFRKRSRKAINSCGFRYDSLMFRQDLGAINTAISKKTMKLHTRGINSETIASGFPFTFTTNLDEEGVYLGGENSPVLLDIWKWDKVKYNKFGYYTNANSFTIGKSGAGKSYFTKTFMSLAYSDNTRIFVLDPENEYKYLCENLDGDFIDVSKGGINPFHIYPILTDTGETASPRDTFNSHLLFMEGFFSLIFEDMQPNEKEILSNLVVETYRRKKITQNTDTAKLKATDYPTFDDLAKVIQDKLKEAKGTPNEDRLNLLAIYIDKFTGEGRYSLMWNYPSTLMSKEDIVIFNFQSLFSTKNNVVINAQTLLILRYLENEIINMRNTNNGIPYKRDWKKAMVFIDEGHMFVDKKTPIALDFIGEWYKRIRKYYGSMNFATQSLSDLMSNDDLASKTKAVLINSQYSFIFSVKEMELDYLKQVFNNSLSETELAEIVGSGKGECFLVSGEKERTKFLVIAEPRVVKMFSEVSQVATPQEQFKTV